MDVRDLKIPLQYSPFTLLKSPIDADEGVKFLGGGRGRWNRNPGTSSPLDTIGIPFIPI